MHLTEDATSICGAYHCFGQESQVKTIGRPDVFFPTLMASVDFSRFRCCTCIPTLSPYLRVIRPSDSSPTFPRILSSPQCLGYTLLYAERLSRNLERVLLRFQIRLHPFSITRSSATAVNQCSECIVLFGVSGKPGLYSPLLPLVMLTLGLPMWFPSPGARCRSDGFFIMFGIPATVTPADCQPTGGGMDSSGVFISRSRRRRNVNTFGRCRSHSALSPFWRMRSAASSNGSTTRRKSVIWDWLGKSRSAKRSWKKKGGQIMSLYMRKYWTRGNCGCYSPNNV